MSLPIVVLAGGLATRMHPLTRTCPKILLPVAGRPFAEHQIELFKRQGIAEVVYCISHLGDRVAAALGDGSKWGMTFRYVFDSPLAGTGGALYLALPWLRTHDAFFVTYGDAYLECDFRAIEQHFRTSGKWGLSTDYLDIEYGLGILTPRALAACGCAPPVALTTLYRTLRSMHQLARYTVMARFHEIGSVLESSG